MDLQYTRHLLVNMSRRRRLRLRLRRRFIFVFVALTDQDDYRTRPTMIDI